jgi:hypothetical protein
MRIETVPVGCSCSSVSFDSRIPKKAVPYPFSTGTSQCYPSIRGGLPADEINGNDHPIVYSGAIINYRNYLIGLGMTILTPRD